MAIYTIEINEASEISKSFLKFIMDYASKSKFITISKAPNSTSRIAIDDARKGKTTKVDSVNALFKED